MNTPHVRTYFLFALLIGAATLAFFVFRPFITTVALAAVFGVFLHPLYVKIRKGIGNRRGIAAFISLLIGVLFVLVPLFMIGSFVIREAQSAYGSVVSSGTGEFLALRVGQAFEPYIPGSVAYVRSSIEQFDLYGRQSVEWILGRAGGFAAGVFSFYIHGLVFLIALYYFLKDAGSLRTLLVKESPLHEKDTMSIYDNLSRTINSVIRGVFVIALVQGTLAGIGYALFGVPNALLWGVCTALAALIPGVGTSLVLIPTILYLVLVGSYAGALGLTLWAIFLVSTIDNFIAPRVMGKGAELHPLVVLISILGGVIFYGPIGIILGPVTISFLFAVYKVYATQAS